MNTVTRKLTDEQVKWFLDDMAGLDMELARVQSRHREFSVSVWLGGDGAEVPPKTAAAAMELVDQARDLLRKADHLMALYQARGEAPDGGR